MINKNSAEHLNSYLTPTALGKLEAGERYLIIPVSDINPEELLSAEEWGVLALTKGYIVDKIEE